MQLHLLTENLFIPFTSQLLPALVSLCCSCQSLHFWTVQVEGQFMSPPLVLPVENISFVPE